MKEVGSDSFSINNGVVTISWKESPDGLSGSDALVWAFGDSVDPTNDAECNKRFASLIQREKTIPGSPEKHCTCC